MKGERQKREKIYRGSEGQDRQMDFLPHIHTYILTG